MISLIYFWDLRKKNSGVNQNGNGSLVFADTERSEGP